jgi:hypothetical protein
MLAKSMAGYRQYEADGIDGLNGDASPEAQSSIAARLRATANVIPAHIWYAAPSGALIFVNSRIADYLGLPKWVNAGVHVDLTVH